MTILRLNSLNPLFIIVIIFSSIVKKNLLQELFIASTILYFRSDRALWSQKAFWSGPGNSEDCLLWAAFNKDLS